MEPFWACAGTLASATAAAVTSAMAREAGFTGRTLLGGLAGFIWDSFGPSVGTRAMDAGNGQYKADTVAAPKPSATKAAEYGSSGAVPRPNGQYPECKGEFMLDKAQRLLAAIGPQRGAAVHGDGRHGGCGAARGARPPHHPYGGRPAGRGRAGNRDRRGAGGALGGPARLYRSLWALRRCAGASPSLTPNGMVSTSIRHASSSPPARRPDLFWRFSPLSRREIAWPWRCRAIRPIAISSPRSAASRCGSRPMRRRDGRSPATRCWRCTARGRSRA